MKKINIKEIIKNYDAILINDWQELRKALDNNKLVMVLNKKKEIVKIGGKKKRERKSTEQLLKDFKDEILFAFKSEITKVEANLNAKIDNVEANINNRLDNIVKLNNLKE